MKPEDIARLVEASDPRLDPTATRVAFVVTWIDLAANQYRSRVWLGDGGGPARPLTAGDQRDSRPRWSPDGERLAFVSHRAGSGSSLHVLPLSGGETTTVATWSEEIEELAWSPDGRWLAFTARKRDEARYGADQDRDRPARRIDRLVYRFDNIGWTCDRPRHLFVVPADGSSGPRDLTPDAADVSGCAWSPDGEQLAFSAALHDTWDLDQHSDIYVVAVAGGRPAPLTPTSGSHNRPSWSPDGASIALVWGDRSNLPVNGQIGSVDAGGRGAARLLTESLDRHCAPYLAGAREPVWDGKTLWFQAEDRGDVHLFQVEADGGDPQRRVAGTRQVTGFDVVEGHVAFTAGGPTGLTEVYLRDGAGHERRLTDFSTSFTAEVTTAEPIRFVATSADGTEVDAWVIPPLGAEPGRSYPALLNIHGGPFTQYGSKLLDELQIQAGHGYAVIFANPRGSSGYGEAWGRSIRGPKAEVDPGTGWGSVDYEDLMAVVDEAVRSFPFVDGDRLGVLGGSYGGYMTTWMVGHTQRFRAACSERAVNNMLTSCWTSDIGPFFDSGYLGVSYLDDPEELLRVSPVSYVKDIHTPLLILHSENDLRCPIEQAEQLFVALRLLGRPVEFVRFPGESHELSRSGAPRHRVERMEIILEFFDRHLRD